MITRKTVLLLVPHLGGGGAERVTALLAGGLPEEKFCVHLGLVIAGQNAASQNSRSALPPSVTVHRLGARRVRGGAWRLLRLVWRVRPDLIVSNMFHLNFLVLLLRPFMPRKTRCVIRQNGMTAPATGIGSGTRALYRILYPRADKIVCQTDAMARELGALLGSERNLCVLPNPVEPNPVEADGAAVSHATDSALRGPGPHLLAVGRLTREKGFDLLLPAFARALGQFPAARLTILGEGPDEAVLKAMSRELGIAERMSFAGYVADHRELGERFAAASLFVLSSRHEAMSNALLEAAAAGLPIVATPTLGDVKALLSGAPGTWVAQEISAEALGESLVEALGALRPKERFTHAWLAPFRMENALAGYESLIDSVLGSVNTIGADSAAVRHIAYLVPTLDRMGGAERQVALLAQGLAGRGWRVTVVALSGMGGDAAAELRASGVAFLSLEMRKGLADPRGWLRLNAWLRRERPEILHAHLPHAAWMARWSRLFAPRCVVIDTIHTAGTGTAGRRLGYRWSNWLADRVTSVSQGAAEAWIAAGMVPRNKIEIVPNGIDTEKWKPDPSVRVALRAKLGLRDEFLWLAAGRLEPVKNFSRLLRAIAALPDNAQLVLAGEGSLGDALRQEAAALSIADRVKFTGYEPNLLRWMQAAHGFVLSSHWEGLPLALLEAGSCGLPCVSTAVAGATEIVAESQTGFLAPAGDTEALTAAMTHLIHLRAAERLAMGEAARLRVAARYGLPAVLDRWEALYAELTAQPSHALRISSRNTEARVSRDGWEKAASARGADEAVP
jgi:glycosyltransferase involved in cell wall biosynthesis